MPMTPLKYVKETLQYSALLIVYRDEYAAKLYWREHKDKNCIAQMSKPIFDELASSFNETVVIHCEPTHIDNVHKYSIFFVDKADFVAFKLRCASDSTKP